MAVRRHRDQVALLALRQPPRSRCAGSPPASIASGVEARPLRASPHCARGTRGPRASPPTRAARAAVMLRAAHPSATWISTQRRAAQPRELTHVVEDRLVVRASARGERECACTRQLIHPRNALHEQPHVEHGDERRAVDQASALSQPRLANAPIFARSRREAHQRKHGERELQAEDHLAEHQQLRRAALAVQDGDDGRRHDGDRPRDQPPQPRPEADVEEPLHHDLAGQRAGERRVLPRREQRQREHGARAAAPSSGVSSLYASWISATSRVPARVEGRRGDDQDRGVDEQRERQRDRRVDEGEAHRLALARRASPRSCASARSTSADRGCAASPSRRGCRWRCRASRGSRMICAVGMKPARSPAERAAARG